MSTMLGAEVIISGFMALTGNNLLNESVEACGWLEILNVITGTVNLLIRALNDSSGYLKKWQFSTTNLGPNRIMIIWASAKNRRDPDAPLNTSFRLAARRSYLALVRPDGGI